LEDLGFIISCSCLCMNYVVGFHGCGIDGISEACNTINYVFLILHVHDYLYTIFLILHIFIQVYVHSTLRTNKRRVVKLFQVFES
jgi:sterol desaturase/sphingolipid hydroxylase (fatty acid hydroxylase superfamily)